MFDNAEMLERVPKYLYVIGGVMAGLQLISFLLVSPRPEEVVPFILFQRICSLDIFSDVFYFTGKRL